MPRFFKIWRLKRRARALYRRMDAILDALGCGETMALFLSPKLGILRAEFRATMDELAQLDPKIPRRS